VKPSLRWAPFYGTSRLSRAPAGRYGQAFTPINRNEGRFCVSTVSIVSGCDTGPPENWQKKLALLPIRSRASKTERMPNNRQWTSYGVHSRQQGSNSQMAISQVSVLHRQHLASRVSRKQCKAKQPSLSKGTLGELRPPEGLTHTNETGGLSRPRRCNRQVTICWM
jgi:hypothetical protein